MKRITISLEDDLYRIAKAYALSEDISLSKAVARLLRRATNATPSMLREEATRYRYRDDRSGFPVTRIGRVVSLEEVSDLIDDEDTRHREHFKNLEGE